jgi:hypothetical protein
MEIVVPFAHRHQSGQHMIPWTPSVIEWLLANPMRETVHTERGLLHETRSYYASIYKSTPPVTPA